MNKREEVIEFCLTLNEAYEDKPFRDPNWTVIRHRANRKVFAWIFEKEGNIWINVKCDPQWRDFWRDAFASVLPAYHLNKEHWNSVILDGSVPKEDLMRMIEESYELTRPKKGKTGSDRKKEEGKEKRTEECYENRAAD